MGLGCALYVDLSTMSIGEIDLEGVKRMVAARAIFLSAATTIAFLLWWFSNRIDFKILFLVIISLVIILKTEDRRM